MINNLEGKSAKELREIILIQQEEYKKLLDENKELESQVKAQQSYIDNALDNSKEELIGRIAELEKRAECTVESFNLEAHNLEQQAKGVSDFFNYHEPRISMGKSAIWEVDNSQVESYLVDILEQTKGLDDD